ncbi:MAG TPA: hypothetical protein VGV88_00605 [Candidatus Dormibacteraeota bacterium]|nr:hypothetical protein [Candidatus Dormibacteraeota bacterium]
MSSILVFCSDCGKQVPSSETKDRLCLDCQVRRSVSELRDEHARLWRKRERYSASGGNVQQIGKQIARTEDRISARIHEMVPNEKRAHELLARELEAARGQRYSIKRL